MTKEKALAQVLALIIRLFRAYGLAAGTMEAEEGRESLGRGKVNGKVLMFHVTDVEAVVRSFAAFAEQEKDSDVLLNYFERVVEKLHKDTMTESPRLTLGAAVHKVVDMIENFLTNASVRGSKGSGGGSTNTQQQQLSRSALEKLNVPSAWITDIFQQKKKSTKVRQDKGGASKGKKNKAFNKGDRRPVSKRGGNNESKLACTKVSCGSMSMCNMSHTHKAARAGAGGGAAAAAVPVDP